MTSVDFLPILLERESEKLRQEKEMFNQNKQHEAYWFKLRIRIGYVSILLLAVIMILSSYIILNNSLFPIEVVILAGGALFGDVLGLLICVWKILLNPEFITKLEPSTMTIQSYDDLINLADKMLTSNLDNDNASIQSKDIPDTKPELIFNAYYGKSHIKIGEETNINFKFKNNTNQDITCISYQFEGYHEGNLLVKYAKHAYHEIISPKREIEKQWGMVDPLKAYFGGNIFKGLFESKIYVEYIFEVGGDIKTVVSSATIIVE